MSVMDDMLAWLTTTLDEIERRERRRLTLSERAGGADWEVSLRDPLTHSVVTGEAHNPRAVLARVAAERAILAEIASSTAQYPDFDGGTVNGLENAAMLIAWGHRHDAPGFLEEWAPSTVEVTT